MFLGIGYDRFCSGGKILYCMVWEVPTSGKVSCWSRASDEDWKVGGLPAVTVSGNPMVEIDKIMTRRQSGLERTPRMEAGRRSSATHPTTTTGRCACLAPCVISAPFLAEGEGMTTPWTLCADRRSNERPAETIGSRPGLLRVGRVGLIELHVTGSSCGCGESAIQVIGTTRSQCPGSL